MTSPLAFPCYGPDEPPSPADIEALCATQVHAARALGQLDAALTWCPPDIYPILAARLIRETLISALRQEGHAFTDARFHAWFAGLVPLSDEPLQFALAPRALVTTLLAEMTRSSWAPLADAARGFEKACLALRDLDNHPAVEAALAAIVQSEALRDALNHLNSLLVEARDICRDLADRYSGKRASSRAPQLYGLLSGFGPLRSSQIEAVLGATRLGVRTMLAALSQAGDLTIETLSGVKLYSVTHTRAPLAPSALTDEPGHFSSEALEDYDAALAQIDALLARYDDRDDRSDGES